MVNSIAFDAVYKWVKILRKTWAFQAIECIFDKDLLGQL